MEIKICPPHTHVFIAWFFVKHRDKCSVTFLNLVLWRSRMKITGRKRLPKEDTTLQPSVGIRGGKVQYCHLPASSEMSVGASGSPQLVQMAYRAQRLSSSHFEELHLSSVFLKLHNVI